MFGVFYKDVVRRIGCVVDDEDASVIAFDSVVMVGDEKDGNVPPARHVDDDLPDGRCVSVDEYFFHSTVICFSSSTTVSKAMAREALTRTRELLQMRFFASSIKGLTESK